MAVKLKKSFVVNVSSVVQNSLAAAKNARAAVQSKQEADFQTAVSGGMSYEAQVAFRQQQISAEKSMSVPDDGYITQLEQSVQSLQKLNRFTKYRAKYQSSFASLKAGTESAQDHLDILNNLLSSTTDPNLREEIQGNIVSASAELKQSQDDILANQIKKAQYDGTPAILSSTISKVKDKKAMATLNGNEDEAAALDATLSVLNQQFNKVTIEDATDKLNVTSISKGLSPTSKLAAMNTQITGTNNTDPVTISGKTYASVADYWTQTRDSYLSGNGSGIFSDFFKELSNSFTDKVNAAVSRDGFATSLTLDGIKADTEVLKTKPEMAPFLDQIQNLQSITLANAFQTTARTIVDRANFTADYKTADTSLQDYAKKYGIDAEGYRLQLADGLVQNVNRVASQKNLSPDQVAKEAGLSDVLTADQFKTPTPTTDVPKPPAPARVFTPKETADLSAAQARITAGTATAVDKQNVAYATKLGFGVTPPTTPPSVTPPVPGTSPTPPAAVPPAPTITPPTNTTPTPNAPVTPQAPAQKPVAPQTPVAPTSGTPPAPAPKAPVVPPVPAPSQTPAPAAAPKPYAGVSVVDYLKSTNQDASHASLVKLAQANGITGYAGTADQNTALLKKLRGV